MSNNFVIISGRPLLEEFKIKAAAKFSVEENRKGLVFRDRNGNEISIKENNAGARKKYGNRGDLDEILERIKTPVFYYMRWESRLFMKEFCGLLLNDGQVMVDGGFHVIVSGLEFNGLIGSIATRSEEVENENGECFYFNKRGPRNEVCFIPASQGIDLWQLAQGEISISEPVEMKIKSGKRFNDIVYIFTIGAHFAISARLRQLLINAGVTGWSTYDLKVENCDHVYYGFICKGRCEPLPATGKNDWVTGYPIKGWDGSDFFCAEGTASLFFTQKVKTLFLQHDIRKVELEDTRDSRWYQL